MSNLEDSILTLQEEIVVRVEAIQAQKEDKKTIMKSYNENIKGLEAERDALIQELNAVKEQIKQNHLVASADKIIEENARPGDEDLSLI